MKYRIAEIQKAVSPNPFALLSTQKADDSTNLMAISWWTFVSNHPATVAVCLSNRGFSGERIRYTLEFGLNIVGEELKEKAFLCGTCSGRERNKAEEFQIPLREADVIRTKLVKGSKVALECRLKGEYAVSDHTIFIAEIVEAHCTPGKKQLYAFDGYAKLDTI